MLDLLTTLDVVVGVRREDAVHASVGNGNNEVAVLVGLSARSKSSGKVSSITSELSAGGSSGRRRPDDQAAAGLDGSGSSGNTGKREDESHDGGGELHDSDGWL